MNPADIARNLTPKCGHCKIKGEPENYRCDRCDESINNITQALVDAHTQGILQAAAAFYGRSPEHHATILILLESKING